jgi:hypothetical protein
MSKIHVDEMETSDDDYVDPSIEKYFNKKKVTEKTDKKSKKKELIEESESDYEVEDEEEEEEDMNDEEEQEQEDEPDQDQDIDEQADDGRKKLTMNQIEKWSEKLSVR